MAEHYVKRFGHSIPLPFSRRCPMVQPSCPKCSGKEFEMVSQQIKNANFPTSLIACSKCGSVLGALENIAAGETAASVGMSIGGKLDAVSQSIHGKVDKILKALKVS